MQRGGNKILTPEICRSYNLSPAEYDDCINYRGHYSTPAYPAYQRGNMVTSNGRTRPSSRNTRSTRDTRDCRTNDDCRPGLSCVNFKCVPGLGSVIGIPNGNGGEPDACNTPGGGINNCELCCEGIPYSDCEETQLNPDYLCTECEWMGPEEQGFCKHAARRGGRIGRRR